jgi:eukaryotic-like serine/threonine-protein kinase
MDKKPARITPRRHRYAVLEELGRGATGIVHRALDTELDRIVAIKLLRPEYVSSLSHLLRLKREVVLASRVLSPYVVRVYDIGEIRGQPLIAMEFIDGESLAALLNRVHRLPPSQVLSISIQICKGLQSVHSAGLVHRDLKPGNLLLDREGKISVADFGLARSIQPGDWNLTAPGDNSTTPFYASPEQLAGLPANARSDLYSFGLVLLLMLTGTAALETLKPLRESLILSYPGEKHLRAVELDSLNTLDRAIRLCLQPDRDARVGSAQELLGYLCADRVASDTGERTYEFFQPAKRSAETASQHASPRDIGSCPHTAGRVRRSGRVGTPR